MVQKLYVEGLLPVGSLVAIFHATKKQLTIFFLCVSVLIGGTAPVWSKTADEEAKPPVPKFVIGRISSRPDAALEDLKAMNAYLRSVLPGGSEIEFGEVVVSSISEMSLLLKSGAVDILSETPLGAIALEQNAGAEIILHEWKKGVEKYAGMIIVHKDSGITSLEGLTDRTIAFEDPGSTSGFLIPLSVLRAQGFTCVRLNSRNETPPPGTIGYIFAGVELNIASLVARDIVAAGAISDLNWNDMKEVPMGFKERLNVIYMSDYVPRSTVLVRPGFPKAVKQRLVQTFRNMRLSEEGILAMARYHGVAQFDPVDAGMKEQLKSLRDMYHLIKDLIK